MVRVNGVTIAPPTPWTARATVAYPGQTLPVFGFGSVGLGLATSLGVAFGAPDAPVALVIGDGGLLMSLGELETVARYGRRQAIVVMNDAAYGAEVHHLAEHELTPAVARFRRTDFAAVAEGLGIEAIRVDGPADLGQLTRLASLDGPILIDARVDPAAISDRFKPKA